MLRHLALVALLTVLTQLGGLAYLVALGFRRRILAFVLSYAALGIAAFTLAPLGGRVPLPCFSSGPLKMQTPLLCALNRQYVAPEMQQIAMDLSVHMATAHAGTQTRALDGNFPFFDGFPLLPHLSHDDGDKLDLALYWQDPAGRYLPGASKSPLGYWGYAAGPSACPARWDDLRWDFNALQTLLPDYRPDIPRLAAALRHLSADPDVAKILIEPHLAQRAGILSSKIRFQGCRAARHDDHIHIQL